MRAFALSVVVLATLFALGSVLGPAQRASAQQTVDGKAVFVAEKCGLCHGVQAAGIQAKTTSEKLKGPDLSGYEAEEGFDVRSYLRKESEKDGAAHRREFKGTDEELQALLDWLKATG
ncbi:MAG: cytochrome c [Thermoanaerobaculia bacterium]|nr:cytochrome c [Thermoanaerobaculia bacterium]